MIDLRFFQKLRIACSPRGGNLLGLGARQKIRPVLCLLTLSFTWGLLLAEDPPTQDPTEFQDETETETPATPVTNLSPSNTNTIAPLSSTNTITPLSSREKFDLAMHNAVFSPTHYVMTGAKAGLSMAFDGQSHYRQGARGYFRRFGDRLANEAVYELAGTWAAASVLHQDPRYYPSPDRRFGSRVKYALTRTVVTRGDDGRPQFNTSNLIGITASSAARAAWYPREEHRVRYAAASIGTGILFDGVGKLIQEFIHLRH